MRNACVLLLVTAAMLLSVVDSTATTPPKATVTMHWRVAPCFSNKHLLCSGASACTIQTMHRCATFASTCYSGVAGQGQTTSAFLAEIPIGQSRFSESGHLSISGFSLDWKGKINGPGPGGSGSGKWTATGVPPGCGSAQSITGTYRSKWVPTSSGVTVTVSLSGFPG
jgi:hypothetical protein